jgi:hypothetical protein
MQTFVLDVFGELDADAGNKHLLYIVIVGRLKGIILHR